jgi:hypothetical protein
MKPVKQIKVLNVEAGRITPRAVAVPALRPGQGTASRPLRTAARLAAGLGLVVLAGCQTLPRPERMPSVPAEAERMRTLGDQVDEADFAMSGQVAARAFRLRPHSTGEELPQTGVTTVSVSEGGLLDALQLLVMPHGLGLVVDGGPRSLERYGSSAALMLSGTLPDLMEQLSESLGFFYFVRNRVLHVAPEERFMLDLPPALGEDNLAGLTNSLQFFGAQDLYLDRINRTVTFRTNRMGMVAIDRYLEHIRSTRSMLLYDVHVYQVDLADGQQDGVKWNKFGWTGASADRSSSGGTGTGTTGTTAATTGSTDITAPFGSSNRAVGFSSTNGFNLGAVIAGPRFNMELLVDFLRTQGNVRSISQPRISLVSGSRGSLRLGNSTTYVAKVGTNAGTNLLQTTVETETINTGFELALFGEEHEGTIYTRINLSISDLIKLNEYNALGTQLTLPETAEREVITTVRARPGDVVLLGGIAAKRDSVDVDNGIGGNRKIGSVARSELVIALRPRILRFTAGAAPLAAPVRGLPARLVTPAGDPVAGQVPALPDAPGVSPKPESAQ